MTAAQAPSGFSPDEVWSVIAAARGLSSDLVLVGGQALAFWARYYSIEPPDDLVPYVTLDVDFLGGAVDARTFAAGLPAARVYIASLDDHTPSSARVVSNNVLGKTLEVDFLHSLAGLSERDVRNSAVSVDAPQGASIRIMHPLHCLESRIVNLALLLGSSTSQARSLWYRASAPRRCGFARAPADDTRGQGRYATSPENHRTHRGAGADGAGEAMFPAVSDRCAGFDSCTVDRLRAIQESTLAADHGPSRGRAHSAPPSAGRCAEAEQAPQVAVTYPVSNASLVRFGIDLSRDGHTPTRIKESLAGRGARARAARSGV